jgi:hypothetical protein
MNESPELSAALQLRRLKSRDVSFCVMRGLDSRIHLLSQKDGLPGQARQ